MTHLPNQVTLVFDGMCGFCTRTVRLLKMLDRNGHVTAIPFQTSGVPEQYGLNFEQCNSVAWVVTPDYKHYPGAAAINMVLAVALGTALPVQIYRLPGMQQIQNRVYDWIARNRRRFRGDTPHCIQHPDACQ